MSQTPILKKRETNSDQNLLIGSTKLGVFGAFAGSFLFVCLHHIAQIAPGILRGEDLFPSEGLADYAIVMVAYFGIGFLITFFVSVIPGALAGVVNAWILYSIISKGSLSKKQGVAIGMIVGFIFCLIPVGISIQFFNFLSFNIPLDGEPVDRIVSIAVTGMFTSAVVGGWHSLKMHRILTLPA